MDHDRLFKQLLRTFFVEFVELFLPEVDAYLDRAHLEFLDKEVFTDVTAGGRHEVDLLVKTRFRERPAYFLVHVETQASAEADFPKRMFRYFARLYEQFDLPVYPVVLFSYDAPLRAEPDEHSVAFPDHTVLAFRYRVIQLGRLNWRDFVRRQNPVAAALMTKMRIAPEDRPRVKLECLRLLLTLKLDKARQTLIKGFMDSYLRLSAAEVQAYNREVQTIDSPEREAVVQALNEWEEIGEIRGKALGRREGEANLSLRLLRRRFGPLPEDLEASIFKLDQPTLEALGDALLDFGSVTEAVDWVRGNG